MRRGTIDLSVSSFCASRTCSVWKMYQSVSFSVKAKLSTQASQETACYLLRNTMVGVAKTGQMPEMLQPVTEAFLSWL